MLLHASHSQFHNQLLSLIGKAPIPTNLIITSPDPINEKGIVDDHLTLPNTRYQCSFLGLSLHSTQQASTPIKPVSHPLLQFGSIINGHRCSYSKQHESNNNNNNNVFFGWDSVHCTGVNALPSVLEKSSWMLVKLWMMLQGLQTSSWKLDLSMCRTSDRNEFFDVYFYWLHSCATMSCVCSGSVHHQGLNL